MNKLLVVLLTMLAFTFQSNAQEVVDSTQEVVDSTQEVWSEEFPGKLIEAIVGKRIKGKVRDESLQKYGFADMSISSPADSYKTKTWHLNDSYNTKYEKVSGKIFTVVSVERYLNIINIEKYSLELLTEKGETIWLNYDPKFEFTWLFLIEGGINITDDLYCSGYVEHDYDDFDDEHTYSSNSSDNNYQLIRVDDRYYLSIRVSALTTAAIGESGVKLILKDGTRLSWLDAELDVKVNSKGDGYYVSAFISLSESDLQKLSTSNPKKCKLYIFKSNLHSSGLGYDYARMFRCIMNKQIK